MSVITQWDSHTLGRIPWSIDRPVGETCTYTAYQIQETNIHAPWEIRTRDPSNRAAVDLRPNSHRDRRIGGCATEILDSAFWMLQAVKKNWILECGSTETLHKHTVTNHKRTYTFFMRLFCISKITNRATVENLVAILVSQSCDVRDSSFTEYNNVSNCKRLLTSRKIVVPSSEWSTGVLFDPEDKGTEILQHVSSNLLLTFAKLYLEFHM